MLGHSWRNKVTTKHSLIHVITPQGEGAGIPDHFSTAYSAFFNSLRRCSLRWKPSSIELSIHSHRHTLDIEGDNLRWDGFTKLFSKTLPVRHKTTIDRGQYRKQYSQKHQNHENDGRPNYLFVASAADTKSLEFVQGFFDPNTIVAR